MIQIDRYQVIEVIQAGSIGFLPGNTPLSVAERQNHTIPVQSQGQVVLAIGVEIGNGHTRHATSIRYRYRCTGRESTLTVTQKYLLVDDQIMEPVTIEIAFTD